MTRHVYDPTETVCYLRDATRTILHLEHQLLRVLAVPINIQHQSPRMLTHYSQITWRYGSEQQTPHSLWREEAFAARRVLVELSRREPRIFARTGDHSEPQLAHRFVPLVTLSVYSQPSASPLGHLSPPALPLFSTASAYRCIGACKKQAASNETARQFIFVSES